MHRIHKYRTVTVWKRGGKAKESKEGEGKKMRIFFSGRSEREELSNGVRDFFSSSCLQDLGRN